MNLHVSISYFMVVWFCALSPLGASEEEALAGYKLVPRDQYAAVAGVFTLPLVPKLLWYGQSNEICYHTFLK
jgi:hypothetical protein